MRQFRVCLATTVIGVVMASFGPKAAAQELKNPLDVFNNAIRQIEQQQKGRPPDTERPSESPQGDPQPPSVRKAWSGLSGEMKDCLRNQHIVEDYYVSRGFAPQDPRDPGLVRAWNTCSKQAAPGGPSVAKVAEFRQRTDALQITASSSEEANSLVRDINAARIDFLKNRVSPSDLNRVSSDATRKRDQIAALARDNDHQKAVLAQQQTQEKKRAAEEEQKLAVQMAVAKIEQRAASAKRWTSASKPNDGSVFLWRDLAIGDPQDLVLAKEPIATCGPSRVAPEVEVCTLLAGYTQGTSLHTLLFKDGKLAGFQYLFEAKDAVDNFRLLAERYGPPQKSEQLKLQTAAGARLDSLRAIWNTPHGPMVFEEHREQVDVSSVEMAGVLRQSAPKPF